MKIGYDAKRFFHNSTGLGNYSRDLLRIVSTFYPSNQYFLYNSKPKKINRIFIDGKTLIEKLYVGLPFLSQFWRLKSITKSLNRDQIAIYHGLSGEIPIGLKNYNIKSIVTVHDLIFIRFPELYNFFDKLIYYHKFKYACKNANLVVAISTQTKNDISTYFGIASEKIKVIYQGCAPVFKETPSKEELARVKQKYMLPDVFLLNVGSIEERKNILTVLQAITNKDIQLVIIGKKTKYYRTLVTYINENNMGGQVLFIENIPLNDLGVVYKLATIFTYPSLFEGFGIPIIEALYSKTPVITSTGSCFSEAGGPHSIYIKPFDIQALEEAILYLLENESARKKQLELGYEYVQRFNDATIANQWMETYNTL